MGMAIPEFISNLSALPEGELVFHFEGRQGAISANTFAGAIAGFCSAAKEINVQINPGFEVDFLLIDVGDGSFRAKIVSVYRPFADLLKESYKPVILGILSAVIYDMALKASISPDTRINVYVGESDVVVSRGSEKIIIQRNIWMLKNKLSNPEKVERGVAAAFGAMSADREVTEFGLVENLRAPEPVGLIPRERFAAMAAREQVNEEGTEIIQEIRTQLIIVRAIFERGRRLWQFNWNGIKISAPIEDIDFFDRMASRDYVFGQGDALDVTLRIFKRWDDDARTYFNVRYEVAEVHGAGQAPRQPRFI